MELLGLGSGVECIFCRDNMVEEMGARPTARPARESACRASPGGPMKIMTAIRDATINIHDG
jgi:hypothetical protein